MVAMLVTHPHAVASPALGLEVVPAPTSAFTPTHGGAAGAGSPTRAWGFARDDGDDQALSSDTRRTGRPHGATVR